jgi:type II secretion system protein J
MRQSVSTQRGLTILEMLGVLAISTILLSGAWQLFQGGMRSYHRGLHDVRMTQGARALLHLMTRDVQRAMAARVPYGIGGPASQLSAETAGRQADSLAMLTLPSPGVPHAGASHGGTLQRIRYVLNTVPGSKTLALQRAVGTASGPQMEQMMVVHRQVQALRVRYFDGQAWLAEWQRAELPRAVEITLMVQSGAAQAQASRFVTLVTAD